ncbi:MAG TPA: DNA/RNA non-specific endonuclease [Pyrinomonadaceae bacterium]
MKKLLFVFAVLALAGVWSALSIRTQAGDDKDKPDQFAKFVSGGLVISQLYGGGGAPGATYNHDFVEFFNRGSQPVSLSGWSFQYASATGTNWIVNSLPNATVQPGQYFLVQFDTENASVGGALPTPDFVAPLANGQTFILNMSRTTAKVALVRSTTQLPASTCPSDPNIVDMLGYGSTASCSEGTRTSDLSPTTAAIRNGGGCTDTDNNQLDFSIATPAARNSSTPVSTCNLGGTLQAGITASPNVVAPGGNTLIRVPVIPATTPPSTGVTVVADLSDVGGPASQQFFDDGTHGDVSAGDNVYSFLAVVSANTTGGAHLVTATVSDDQGRHANLQQQLTINAPLPDEDPLILGNPNNATPDIANENNYLMPKPQYTLSYNRSRGEPNWVAWRLDSSWVGGVQRQDDYRPDPALPIDWYHVTDTDYSGSGYERGHMCPSGDRTNTVENNSATFLMTNFVPQTSNNNQGPWEDLETYCRTLASQGNELYIVDGPVGNLGTIANGNVVIPQYTWKVVLVLPNGVDDLHRIGKGTRAFGFIVPNFGNVDINAPWRNYRVTVDQVERLTGYDFFRNVPKITQEMIERRHDHQ